MLRVAGIVSCCVDLCCLVLKKNECIYSFIPSFVLQIFTKQPARAWQCCRHCGFTWNARPSGVMRASLKPPPQVHDLDLRNVFFKRIYLFIFRKGEGREKERERNINVWLSLMHPLLGTWPETQACALTGSWNGDPLIRRQTTNPRSHTSQSGTFVLFCFVLMNLPFTCFALFTKIK